jgi:hypothetical protein
MVSRTALLGVLALFTVGSSALVACSAETDDSNASAPTDDEIKKSLGALGAPCSATKKCKTELVCKAQSSGPPPGAMGLPLAPGSSTSGGPPPGAMGMPLAPSGTCANPDPGTEGGLCTFQIHCHAGLTCEYPELTPHPSSSGGPPPGAMGMPLLRTGTCKPTSSGPPPGAMGLPINPNK